MLNYQLASGFMRGIMPNGHSSPIELFISYSHRDDGLREKLDTHLALMKRQGVIDAWHDRRIIGGREWAGEIDQHLNSARIIVLLVSPDFIASDYCYEREMTRALERHDAGEARVIPVILRHVDWAGAPFGRLQALPKDAKPVRAWGDEDEAFFDIARGIRKVAEEIRPKQPSAGRSPSLSGEATGLGQSHRLWSIWKNPSEKISPKPTDGEALSSIGWNVIAAYSILLLIVSLEVDRIFSVIWGKSLH